MITAFIFVKTLKLRLSIIRILAENNIPFVEASDIDEALFKLDLIQDITLIIEEYQDGENKQKLVKAFRGKGAKTKIPIIWLVPGSRKDLIALAAKCQITDLIPLPLDEETFIRKVNAIIGTNNESSQKADMPTISPKVLSYHSQDLINELESAEKGKYPISIIFLRINGIREDENIRLIDSLKSVLRGNDAVMEVDSGQFIILLPFTPKASLPIVESKVKDAAQEVVNRRSGSNIHIYGVCFPDDIQSYDDLIAKLTGGIEQSMEISKKAEVYDSDWQKKLSKYRNTSRLNRIPGLKKM